MNIVEYVHGKKGRYMAQILTEFEETVEQHLPEHVANNFKGTVRQKLNAMAVDISEVVVIEPFEINAVALELPDELRPGNTRRTRT